MWLPWDGLPIGSTEGHAGEEWDRSPFLAHEPLEGFLEDSLSGDAVSFQDGVEAALSCI